MSEIATTIESLTGQFLDLHSTSNALYWAAKMRLGQNVEETEAKLASSELAYQEFYEDASWLKTLANLEGQSTNSEEIRILQSWQRMFRSSAIADEKTRAFSRELLKMQLDYDALRGKYEWGYTDPGSGKWVSSTSNTVSNIVVMDDDEAMRKAAFDGLRNYELFTLDNGFLELIRARNKFARMLGYEDYYECTVQRSEGLSKREIFELLDAFELKTRDRAKNAVEQFAREHGDHVREPWNFGHFRRGSLIKERDPYLKFEEGLGRWVRTFSALGVRFRGATLTLDLIDRQGKHINGFMHTEAPSFRSGDTWNPARINFCAHAIPNEQGTGEDALKTLFHEGGHAAHFANITQDAPTYSFGPLGHHYTETQSMFMDRILTDADWMTRYTGMPFKLIERSIKQNQPFEASVVRRILVGCYFERALYELPDSELTKTNVLKLLRETERRIWFLNDGPRPLLAATHPHDAPVMSHGYLLALMAVYQTREYFQQKYGYIMDNPNVCAEITECYWEPGNSKPFFDMVNDMTGKPFSADALVRSCTHSVEESTEIANSQVAKLPSILEFGGPYELDAHVRVIHGDETICEFRNATEFESANERFIHWVTSRYPRKN